MDGQYQRPVLDNPLAEDFVSRCLTQDPKKRAEITELVEHPLLWSPEQKLRFLKQVWESKTNKRLDELDGQRWIDKIDPSMGPDFRKQFADNVRDQLRCVRILSEHGTQKGHTVALRLAPLVGCDVGETPAVRDVTRLVEKLFPGLLISIYLMVKQGILEGNMNP